MFWAIKRIISTSLNKWKYVHEVLVNCLVKLAQEKKVWLGELTVPTDCPNMTIAVDWDVKHQTKEKQQKNTQKFFSLRMRFFYFNVE